MGIDSLLVVLVILRAWLVYIRIQATVVLREISSKLDTLKEISNKLDYQEDTRIWVIDIALRLKRWRPTEAEWRNEYEKNAKLTEAWKEKNP